MNHLRPRGSFVGLQGAWPPPQRPPSAPCRLFSVSVPPTNSAPHSISPPAAPAPPLLRSRHIPRSLFQRPVWSFEVKPMGSVCDRSSRSSWRCGRPEAGLLSVFLTEEETLLPFNSWPVANRMEAPALGKISHCHSSDSSHCSPAEAPG